MSLLRIITRGLLICILLLPSVGASESWENTPWQKWAESNPDWVAEFPPFNILGNIYYVGTEGIGAYLITGEDGHILLDGGLPQSALLIAHNIQKLGFALEDVKHLINSHAHFDHSGGLKQLKDLTGARMVASLKDKKWLENGLYPGSSDLVYKSIPVSVDQTIKDGEILELGTTKLVANLTPGHTPGCTSWMTNVKHQGRAYRVLLFCSASVAGNQLVPKPQSPGIVEDYRLTFEKLKDWEVDVYLSNHPFFFNMKEKRKSQIEGDSNAFISPAEFTKAAEAMQQAFEKRLAEQEQEALNRN